jgi:hypothetical protein
MVMLVLDISRLGESICINVELLCADSPRGTAERAIELVKKALENKAKL